ncbi:MAG: hypothetical protein HUU57_04450 [Bdellovibrio sp.]|nr:hypothetical protein [Bdellovibrio sp.]
MRHFLSLCIFAVLVVCAPLAQAQVQAYELQIVIHAFNAEYREELAKANAQLVINNPPTAGATDFWWNRDEVRASYSTSQENGVRTHYIFMMGGYARMQGMTVDGVIATICHELGHGLAGSPYKEGQDGGAKISVEGQADYFAYTSCLPRMFKRLTGAKSTSSASEYAEKICSARFIQSRSDQKQYDYCLRAIQTLETEKTFFWQSTRTSVDLSIADRSVILKTDLSADYYPSPQCRFDTMLAGILQGTRPRCWFKEE